MQQDLAAVPGEPPGTKDPLIAAPLPQPLVHGVDEQVFHLEPRQVALAEGAVVPGSDV